MPDWISSDVISFAVFTGLVIAAALFGGQWSAGPWYESLSKPSWTPPNWAFPIAWSILYLMIAVAGWLLWESDIPSRETLLWIWAAQLLLNAVWSYIFFGRKQIMLAYVDIVALWTLICVFIVMAWDQSQLIALLFVPYLLWVSYAATLNQAIWRLNRPRPRHMAPR